MGNHHSHHAPPSPPGSTDECSSGFHVSLSLIPSFDKTESSLAKSRSRFIDRRLKHESKDNRKKSQVKVLLLGAGESGKSTILKQMKIIHLNGFSASELDEYRPVVVRNILESIRNLTQAIHQFDISYINADAKLSESAILQVFGEDGDLPSQLSPELGRHIQCIWQDPACAKAMERSNEFYMMDTAPYFFQNLDRICDPEYIPSEADILRTRVKSTGITETRFNMDMLSIKMFDVGGQRSERRKWIHCFDGVTSVIFTVALNEYDQVLLEENRQNRMAESLVLFESIVNSKWFSKSSVILFLNKIDLFEEKLKRVSLDKYFPEYAGQDDFEKACKFMIWRFRQANKFNLPLYPHLTCATDTEQIRVVFASVRDTLLNNTLKATGLM